MPTWNTETIESDLNAILSSLWNWMDFKQCPLWLLSHSTVQYSTVLPGLHVPTHSAPHVGCTAVILRLFSSISSGCCVRPGKRDKTAEELRRRDRPSDRREGRDVDTRGCSSAPGLTGPSLTLVLVSVHRQHKKRHIIINITAQHSTNSEAEHHILLSQRDSF